MSAKEIGAKLVEMVRAGQYMEAIDDLYADDIVSIEAIGDEQMPARMEGIEAIRGKAEWWMDNHEVHSVDVEGPYPNEDRFAVVMGIDVTPKVGPAACNRIQMREVCLYEVREGKIVREDFFYDAG